MGLVISALVVNVFISLIIPLVILVVLFLLDVFYLQQS